MVSYALVQVEPDIVGENRILQQCLEGFERNYYTPLIRYILHELRNCWDSYLTFV